MKRVLITGKGSYIGTSFVQYVQAHYAEDLAVDSLDLCSDGWKEVSFSGYDAVFHVAGIAHRKETNKNRAEYFSVNRDLALLTAEKAKSEGVGQFVFLSSMSVYADHKNINITSETPFNPKGAYGESKLQADLALQEMNTETFRVAVLRPPMVFGKGCKGNFPRLVGLIGKLRLFPNYKNARSMLYIDNLCEIIARIVLEGAHGVFFPQNGEYFCTSELAAQIAAAKGKKIRLTRAFNFLVRMMMFVSPVKKMFGNLTYDGSLSDHFGGAYRVADNANSIQRSL